MAQSGDEKTVPMPASLSLVAPSTSNTWCALTEDSLPVGTIYDWCVQPQCGAIVVFSGVVRDHAEHRTGVTLIEYEAYESQVVPRLESIAAELRRQWPDAGRVAILHRVGPLKLGESSVVVGVSTPHRGSAFAAAEFGIDSLKATVPIWKREFWDGGSDWGLAATDITEANLLRPASHANQSPSVAGPKAESNAESSEQPLTKPTSPGSLPSSTMNSAGHLS
jgi:molybdopterin synthase catalytic subunit